MPTLDWIGKKAVENHHKEVPYRLLKCVPELSVGEPGSGNLLVQGDNLEALKALLPYYGGKVKCIYIDPPYNTGNENWVYNDAVNSPEMKQWLGEVVGRDDLSRHDKWLCMMYPRLMLLREFLTDDGCIFISIDDNELAHVQNIMCEIFGETNIIASLVWEKGKKGDAKLISVTHEYIVVAAKNKTILVSNNTKWRRRKPGVDIVLSKYHALKKELNSDHQEIRKRMMAWYRSLPKDNIAKAHKHYNWSDDRGLYFPDNFHGPDDGRKSRPRYDILHPITGKPCAKPSTGWRWEEERTKKAMTETPPRIHFGPDESTIPNRKTYLFEVNAEPFQSVFYKDGRGATLEVEALLGKGRFSFPKDPEILADLVALVTDNDSYVLDSFAGSGTTGHAVLKLNQQDDGNRRFILVEMEPNIAQEITAERLRRVAEGYTNNKGEKVEGIGGGFRFCEIGVKLFDADGTIHEAVKFADLAHHVFFTEMREPLPKANKGDSPLLGVANGTAVYLLYNGILKDKDPKGGNVLTMETLKWLPDHEGTKVVYGTACTLGERTLKRHGITFRQIPYEVKAT